MEVGDHGAALCVKLVLLQSAIARLGTLDLAESGERMLYGGALAPLGAPFRRRKLGGHLLMQSLVRVQHDDFLLALGKATILEGALGAGRTWEIDGFAVDQTA
jgi:hypothetical protein